MPAVRPYEETQTVIAEALAARFGDGSILVETWPDGRAVFSIPDPDDPDEEPLYLEALTAIDDVGGVTLARVAPVAALADEIALMYAVAGMPNPPAGAKPPPPYILKLPAIAQRQFCEVWNSAYARAKARGLSDADAEAAAFAQANGVVNQRQGVAASDATDMDWYAQTQASHVVAIRLDDAAATLPTWQPFHVIGKWSVPHAVSGKILFTKEMGDSIIRNFKANVLRRRVPFDERHKTLHDGFEVVEQNGLALGWAEDYRWGKEGEGLPGAPEPSGDGPILYTKWTYTDLGHQRLSGKPPAYLYGSPHYTLDYVDKQSSAHYGPTALAYAATNDPFIRNIRNLHGEPAMPWVDPAQLAADDIVILTDGLRPYRQEGTMPPETTQPTTPPATPQTPAPAPADVALAERVSTLEQALQRERERADAAETARKDERREHYLADVDAFFYARKHAGVPPGSLAPFEKILRQLNPDAPAVISLSDDDTAPKLPLAAALQEAIGGLVPVDLSVRTFVTDRRPVQADPALDDQVWAAAEEKLGKELAAKVIAARPATNGAHA